MCRSTRDLRSHPIGKTKSQMFRRRPGKARAAMVAGTAGDQVKAAPVVAASEVETMVVTAAASVVAMRATVADQAEGLSALDRGLVPVWLQCRMLIARVTCNRATLVCKHCALQRMLQREEGGRTPSDSAIGDFLYIIVHARLTAHDVTTTSFDVTANTRRGAAGTTRALPLHSYSTRLLPYSYFYGTGTQRAHQSVTSQGARRRETPPHVSSRSRLLSRNLAAPRDHISDRFLSSMRRCVDTVSGDPHAP